MEKIFLWETTPHQIDGEHLPYMTYYPPSSNATSTAVVICPGGAYARRSDFEGAGYASFLSEHGIHSFVLEYRVAPARFPSPLLDARRAVRYVRYLAGRYGIERVLVMGSSAGGHLCALLSTYRGSLDGEGADIIDSYDYLPDGQILCYPVIDADGHRGSFLNLLGEACDELKDSVNPAIIADGLTPPAFVWHTANDPSVDVRNTYRYVTRLCELKIPYELHIFPDGPHGIGLANMENICYPYVARWSGMLLDWLGNYGFI